MEGKLLKSGVLSASLSKSQAASAKSATVLYDYKTHNFVAHNNVEGNSQTKERPVVIAHIATVPASSSAALLGATLARHRVTQVGLAGGVRRAYAGGGGENRGASPPSPPPAAAAPAPSGGRPH